MQSSKTVGDSRHFLLENAGLGDGPSPKMAPISAKLHLGVKTQRGKRKGAQSRASAPSSQSQHTGPFGA